MVPPLRRIIKGKLTTNIGNLIVVELAKEYIKEAFRHLKGW